jgi:hypothetical protein
MRFFERRNLISEQTEIMGKIVNDPRRPYTKKIDKISLQARDYDLQVPGKKEFPSHAK